MTILIDVNLSPLWISFLAEHGFKAVHWSSVGDSSAPDAEILEHAAANGYVVLTHDLDFGMLLAARSLRRPSVVQVRCQDVLPESMGAVLLSALLAAQDYLKEGALLTVEVSRHRIRVLPI